MFLRRFIKRKGSLKDLPFWLGFWGLILPTFAGTFFAKEVSLLPSLWRDCYSCPRLFVYRTQEWDRCTYLFQDSAEIEWYTVDSRALSPTPLFGRVNRIDWCISVMDTTAIHENLCQYLVGRVREKTRRPCQSVWILQHSFATTRPPSEINRGFDVSTSVEKRIDLATRTLTVAKRTFDRQ